MKKALIAGLFALAALPAAAATNADEALAERAQSFADAYHTVGVAMADIFQKSSGFMSGAEAFSPPMARKKFGFNLGLVGGATATTIDKSAAQRNVNNSGAADFVKQLPDAIPVPQAGLNLHFGIPSFLIFESFDLGLRYTTLNISASEVAIDLKDTGFDIKGNVFEAGLVSPVTLTLGLSADMFQGAINFKKSETLNDSTTVSGYTASGTVVNGIDVDMKNQAYSIRAVVSRKLLFFNPYLGVAAQVNSGTTDFRGYQSGTVTMTGPGSPSSATSNATVEGKASAPVGGLDMRIGGGFELTVPFFYISFNGEYGAVSGGYGGNVQIGTQFR